LSVSPPPRPVSAGPAFAVVMGPVKFAPPSSDRHTGLAFVSEEPMLEGAVIQIVCGWPAVPCVPGGARLMLGSPRVAEPGSTTGAVNAVEAEREGDRAGVAAVAMVIPAHVTKRVAT